MFGPQSEWWVDTPSFQGKTYDEYTGLYYFQARYYDPTTGRFDERDPQSSYGASAYAFANNNPIMGRDPSGQFPSLGSRQGWICAGKVLLFAFGFAIAMLGIGANPRDFVDRALTSGLTSVITVSLQTWLSSLGSVRRDPVAFMGKIVDVTFKMFKNWWLKGLSWWKRAWVGAQIAMSFFEWPIKVLAIAWQVGTGLYDLWEAGCF
jgi:RHS repeat-associated protein